MSIVRYINLMYIKLMYLTLWLSWVFIDLKSFVIFKYLLLSIKIKVLVNYVLLVISFFKTKYEYFKYLRRRFKRFYKNFSIKGYVIGKINGKKQ